MMNVIGSLSLASKGLLGNRGVGAGFPRPEGEEWEEWGEITND